MKRLLLLPLLVLAACKHTYTSNIQVTYLNGNKDTVLVQYRDLSGPEFGLDRGDFIDNSTTPSTVYRSYVRSYKILNHKIE